MKVRFFFKYGLVAILIGIALHACSSDPQVVNVTSARHYDDNDRELFDIFTEQTGIEVALTELIENDSEELSKQVEDAQVNEPIDVFMVVDSSRLWQLEQANLFQPIKSDIFEKVPANLRHSDGLWIGLMKRARVLVYNVDNVDPAEELSTYEALAEPQWQGRVCVRTSQNTYNQSLIGSMIENKGTEATAQWAEGLAKNLARSPEGGDVAQIKAVASGICDVAIVNHYYWVRLAKSDEPENKAVVAKTKLFFPNQGQNERGAHVNISGAGILAAAPNSDNASKLIEFLLGPEAQAFLAEHNSEYPVIEGVELDPILADLDGFKKDPISVATYGPNISKAEQLAKDADWE